ncbi:Ubiquitin-like-conjugating enzyme ATG10 [Sesamum angolense]|uniref:Ubiquitin-like-conjugating enzyme ATG10 n=1 Tax=Sesamum angolense TaxID=2727404 RepID=A0AAE1XBK5_9LAMI|nr:Ubiquitin-like-conjugating enzyme ATG10 [Sesamum angolense]
MVVSSDGTLSSTEFYFAASAFSEQWTKFNSALPQWSWVPSPKRPWIPHNQVNYVEEGYLSVENVILPKLNEIQNDGAGAHHYDFHVVYSASYRVPVLYFRAYCSVKLILSILGLYQLIIASSPDGQPLLLDDMEKDLPLNSVEQLTRSRRMFITQEEHPQLNRPWYTLHPCGTSEWMKLLLCNDASAAQVEGYLWTNTSSHGSQ